MTKESNDKASESKGGRPGPADHGGDGGMATRENAPELIEEVEAEQYRPQDADSQKD